MVMLSKVLAVVGCAVIIGLAYLMSKEKHNINWRSVAIAFIGQFLLSFLLIKTPLWKVVEYMSNGVTWLLAQANEGINFVFGGVSDEYVFFINALLPVVFISALMGILFHYGILQKIITSVSRVVAKWLQVDALVSVNGIANMFLGQGDSLFVTKSYLPNAKDSVIFATLVGGMTSISASVIGLYASMGASITWILVSLPLSVISTFALTQIVMPTEYDESSLIKVENDKGVNMFDTMMNYANSGFKSVVGITVALIVFLSLVSMINNFIGLILPSVSLERIVGYVFMPFSFLMGVPTEEIGAMSQILATKLITNETVAFGLPQFAELSENSRAMATMVLCSFANISSIGILIGGYSAIAPDKVKVVAKIGVRALIVATLVPIMSAMVIGLFL